MRVAVSAKTLNNQPSIEAVFRTRFRLRLSLSPQNRFILKVTYCGTPLLPYNDEFYSPPTPASCPSCKRLFTVSEYSNFSSVD